MTDIIDELESLKHDQWLSGYPRPPVLQRRIGVHVYYNS